MPTEFPSLGLASSARPPDCGLIAAEHSYFGLRVAAIFIIFMGSTLGALFPVLAQRSRLLHRPICYFFQSDLTGFAKFFGSGVIIGTAFIHLLAPGIDSLGSECLSEGWRKYPYALGLCLFSVLSIFLVEIITLRWGTTYLAKFGVEQGLTSSHVFSEMGVSEAEFTHDTSGNSARVIGIVILEFGAILHSILIGLTLAVDPKFKVLFAVIVTHQMFEGLGIGSRLASVTFPSRYSYMPIVGATFFGLSTPVGIAVGLAVRRTYSPNDPGALIISGVLDSLSSGILIYTGLVELLAHEILFDAEMMTSSNMRLASALFWVFLGCTVMALLGKWV
ncbi:ZIP-like iron-zinc transporter [Mycena sp. CBHHK59/15]|nr:ZIP-like iron-zinc transporter [Mycena sp. CBHHK59/15]